ncbi:carboxypeptidase-like regulatory domain-containing protein [Neolewinella persica]|uniref:carboxypeptidase-like regulatory domain-containing protein n=1 Tax=Neolewinella persica TaxID=70998 RepID=UPI0003796370|nr:carboxypeptidase-like regulatory domain-containing protein [Neolewinella persica]
MRPLLILFYTALSLSLFAQSTFSGCVTDELDEPLIGAAISHGAAGTVTDVDGCFSLEASGDSVLLKLSYTGYVEQKVMVYAGKSLTIQMVNKTELLEEVVVTEYRVPLVEMDRTTTGYTVTDEVPGPLPAYSTSRKREHASASPGRSESAFADEAPGASAAQAAGQLTAGESNDFGKWDLWEDISKEDLAEFRDIWQLYPDNRYAVQLTYPGGSPAVDVEVELRDGQGGIVWAARTDNQGRSELWRGMMNPKANEQAQLQLVASVFGKEYALPTSHHFKMGLNTLELPVPCERRTEVDIAFVVDATGSMGDEISYLSSELSDVILRTQANLKDADLRTAAVFYRDSTDAYVTQHQQFASDYAETVAYVNKQTHGGGGDHPEAVDAALETALIQLEWRETAASRLLFLVLDAPPHQDADNVNRLQEMTALAAKQGVRIIPIVCSGMTKDGEYLLRSIALGTNGTYVFLTDDSGIGGTHLKPTTDSYDVEKLNDLMVRVIRQFSETQECGAEINENSLVKADQTKVEIKFRAYPNPTSGPVTVKLPESSGEVFVLDMLGKLLRRIPINARKQTIDLGGLASGTYLLRYEDGDKLGAQRIVLTR